MAYIHPAAEPKTHTVITGEVVAQWLRLWATVWEVVSSNLSLARCAVMIQPLSTFAEP